MSHDALRFSPEGDQAIEAEHGDDMHGTRCLIAASAVFWTLAQVRPGGILSSRRIDCAEAAPLRTKLDHVTCGEVIRRG